MFLTRLLFLVDIKTHFPDCEILFVSVWLRLVICVGVYTLSSGQGYDTLTRQLEKSTILLPDSQERCGAVLLLF